MPRFRDKPRSELGDDTGVRAMDPLGRAVHPRVSRQDLRHRFRRRGRRRRNLPRHRPRPQPAAQPGHPPGRRARIAAADRSDPQAAEHPQPYNRGLRVTDAETLDCVLEGTGHARSRIEALLSLGVANSPMAGARIRVVGGNFLTAKPIGVLDGVDMQWTGEVRRVDVVGDSPAARRRRHRAGFAARILAHRGDLQPGAGRGRDPGRRPPFGAQADLPDGNRRRAQRPPPAADRAFDARRRGAARQRTRSCRPTSSTTCPARSAPATTASSARI